MKKDKSKKSCKTSCCPERLGKVGGQAVLEGVMMKAGDRTVTTCRKEDGTLAVVDSSFVSIRTKCKFFNLPLIRGVVSFFESMALSVKTLGASADAMGLEEEEPSKFEKWLAKKFGANIIDFVMVISVILGLALSVLLFVFLPIWVTAGINLLLDVLEVGAMPTWASAVVEGLVKVIIFIAYLSLVSLMKDIRRTFMYHGAEHKSIACFEAGVELTPENAAKYSRFHPRCGTSFMFFMILLGIFAGLIIKTLIGGLPTWAYTLIRLAILPILMGLGFEIIRFAGKHPNFITRAISAPGLWVQRITTKEPTLDMLEVAITSLKCALRDDFPEFKEFYDEKPWEPKAEEISTEADAEVSAEKNNTAADAEGAKEEAPADTAPAASENASVTEEGAPTQNSEDSENDA